MQPHFSDNPATGPETPTNGAAAPDKIAMPSDEELMAQSGIELVYSTSEAADFFNRSPQWIYWGLRKNDEGRQIFVWDNGSNIEPERLGDPVNGKRLFTIPILQRILEVSYRRGNIAPDELRLFLRRIFIDTHGGDYRAVEGWPKNSKGKYINPNKKEDPPEVKAVPADEPEEESEPSSAYTGQ